MARSGDGSIVAERLTGRIELRSSDGSIRAIETSGELLAETADGTITLEEVTGRIEARTGDGSVHVSGMPSVLGGGCRIFDIRLNSSDMAVNKCR